MGAGVWHSSRSNRLLWLGWTEQGLSAGSYLAPEGGSVTHSPRPLCEALSPCTGEERGPGA